MAGGCGGGRKWRVLFPSRPEKIPHDRTIAPDQNYREVDLAINFCEDVAPFTKDQVSEIVTMFEAVGAKAKISSIHVNGWFGDYDKLSTVRLALKECFDIDIDRPSENVRCIFAGDSPNDSPMFQFFDNAVGVANVRKYLDQLDAEPAFVTQAPSGEGFRELANAIIGARGG